MPVFTRPTRGFYIALIVPALFAAEMVYENTALSWSRGPQMIGFSLLHIAGILILPVLLASIVWCATTILVPLISKRWNLGNIAGAVLICVLLVIATLPYGFWVKMFAQRIASGPHSAEFLVHMAGQGELPALGALLDAGVPVNASNRNGVRAIEAAENAKQTETREFLVSKGGTDKRF